MLHLWGKHWASECAQNALKKGGGQPKAGEQGRHLEEEMTLCCMMSCAPGKGAGGVEYPTVLPSKTEPCGAKIIPVTHCKEKIMEQEVREGSGCEEDDAKVGADGERGLPMDPRITIPPTNKKVE